MGGPWSGAAVQIKICGVTSIADAEAAVTAGADLLGIIFAPASRRCVTVETGQQIVTAVRGRCRTVAVFQDAPVSTVNAVATAIGCDFIQLHGRETPAAAGELVRPVIRAVVVTAETTAVDVLTWATAGNVAHLLFDRPKGVVDPSWVVALGSLWAAAHRTVVGQQSFLAGGLTSDNVCELIQQWRPFGVDVASGVESAPGHKDAACMRRFCRAVRTCDGG